jgi:hypothetical protein
MSAKQHQQGTSGHDGGQQGSQKASKQQSGQQHGRQQEAQQGGQKSSSQHGGQQHGGQQQAQQGGQKSSSQHGGQKSSQRHGGQQQAEAPAGRSIPNPVQIQKFLGGLDYPVKRADLIERARSEGADENTLGALLRIPDREYDSPVSVSKEVGDLD